MESRRKRKRKRQRLLAPAIGRVSVGERGDRTAFLLGGWGEASRSDLILLSRAIRNGWPVPVERRRPILEEIANILGKSDERLELGVVRVFIAAKDNNIEIEHQRLIGSYNHSSCNLRRTAWWVD